MHSQKYHKVVAHPLGAVWVPIIVQPIKIVPNLKHSYLLHDNLIVKISNDFDLINVVQFLLRMGILNVF